ncbi:type II toxin-antitoxin system RelE/ParE family toxin [Rhizobium ruizarguesonis]|nr:type II toxin-antitoxin system RelE/ParE family toxin [Rhizobium ruizarguesonis]NKL10841.1 type II toxin-antitoxin system RelE/ParE family toxin [Rhizobium leguminosarum bv. viciae]NEJ01300.1 type II toxin-antitoxin system RelE/ParE family toxin [Rhizobium ruizarguesonis]NEJ34918.1 type II toxin-antitoxin system RelE/ParE family toxin [Rhizobium ruizarguesonis]TAT93002.1 type II toxin-antitoxin system RelE/ParE family toxin [Rhizobium ruizarguesonis]TAZ05023.1 type II toxin-antitoxin system
MPSRILFAEEEERDIEDLYRFIASRDGAETAEPILTDIESACAELEEFATRGNISEELAGSEFPNIGTAPKAMAPVYRIMGIDVVGYCVVGGRRDIQSFLERRLIRRHPAYRT